MHADRHVVLQALSGDSTGSDVLLSKGEKCS